MIEPKFIWNNVKERARIQIRDYEEALEVSKAMMELADEKLRLISGSVVKNAV